MLLRASGEELGDKVELRAALGEGGGGVAKGEILARFAEAATRGTDDLDAVRAELLKAVGPEALVEAASTVGAFSGLVRTADSTGIPLDGGTLSASVDFRAELGLNAFSGASSTDLDAVGAAAGSRDVRQLFS